ncbi:MULTISPECIES: DUF1214 domain-containing protein [Halocynthiibacter]|uniref:DUF1214 domain-containing protein n=1 Tax=Halocynthiibacter halioticoli TaxID=2986804 RepID=A0AAE3IYY2_9RHOB|nr:MULTISPECIES: DUF1214 domain-containing protein [Halocynthiibacter]MCV6824887.1 DUF1214 domain-containing protein [Halocynthiibacter halioticoli]MCW4057888.1 DUF1214 domain-containing protein [Halocynthiibacter sp. SDUM655004]
MFGRKMMQSRRGFSHLALSLPAIATMMICGSAYAEIPVSVDTFVRAETDLTMKRYVDQGGFGKFFHIRVPVPLDKQDVIRMNRDTLYSAGVFDLDAGPVTIVKPDSDGRFQSMLIINEDHSMLPVEHGAGEFTFSRREIGTRYVIIVLRTFVDATSEEDIKTANALQDAVQVKQVVMGSFVIPDWNEESLVVLRKAINVLAATKVSAAGMFGDKNKLNPIDHLLGTAYGWGGNPVEAAAYENVVPEKNDGKTPYVLEISEAVPVDGFVSVTVYNKDGFMEPNDLGMNSINNVTAKRNDDGSVTVHFGDCNDGRINCLPITEGWNYIVRMYQPREELTSGGWTFPPATPVQ